MGRPPTRHHGDGTLRKYETQKGPRWLIQWYEPINPHQLEGPKKRRSLGGFTRASDATNALQQIRATLTTGQPTPTRTWTITDYLGHYLENHRGAHATIADYRRKTRLHINPHIGHLPLTAILPSTLSTLYHTLQKQGLGPNTVRKIHHLLSGMLSNALADGLIPTNPARNPHSNPPTSKETEQAARTATTWDSTQTATFLNWLPHNTPYHLMWETLTHTGIRRGELAALTWSNLTNNNLTITHTISTSRTLGQGSTITKNPPKGGRTRTIPIPPQLAHRLATHRTKQPWANLQPDSPIFPNSQGHHQTPDSIGRAWDRMIKTFHTTHPHIPRITMHEMRHTHATILIIEAGIPIKIVQDRLGHSTITTTLNTYTHPTHQATQTATTQFTKLVGA